MATRSPSRTALCLSAILLVGFVLRVLPATCHAPNPMPFFSCDSSSYHWLACNLLAGKGYSSNPEPPFTPTVYRPPGYPLILAAVYSVFGVSVLPVLVLQALVACAAILVTFLFARELTGRVGVALVAAAVVAIDPVAIIHANTVETEGYTCLIALLSAWAMLRYAYSGQLRWLVLTGALLAAGILIHPILLFLPAVLLAAPLLAHRGRCWRHWAVGGLSALLALGPAVAWMVRNGRVADYPRISSVIAVNMLKYKAAGVEADLRGTTREVERSRLTAECEALLPPDATPGDRFRLWERRGREILLAHPGTYCKVHAVGMFEEFFGPDRDNLTCMIYGLCHENVPSDRPPALPGGRRFGEPTPRAPGLAVVGLQGLLTVCLLLGLGALGWARDWKVLAALLALPAYVLLLSGGPESEARFRAIYVPMLAVLTALGILQLEALARRVRLRRRTAPALQPATS
jgi:4-amino-4-deoxy-L-arabinose transferase-like glycosyltransferase